MICAKGIWDDTIPGIRFDKQGISNFARIQENLMKDFPRGKAGILEWEKLVVKIKAKGKNHRYDCIIGVSGGTDSSYLLHVAKKYNLRPLAVNLDNGWNSDIAVKNIKKVTSALDIDLDTYVIDYEEIKDILRSYMRAILPWIDGPTDLAIQSVLYKYANKEKIKYILIGNDFRSEGKQPTEWTYTDTKQLKSIHKRFGQVKLKTYPIVSMPKLFYLGYFKGIKLLSPFNFINYNKAEAQDFLIKNYDWQYYGEHHHENLFTKWVIGYWMYKKFGIDKRKITYSAQILSGSITRNEALDQINKLPYEKDNTEDSNLYIQKKLGISKDEFNKIWESENKLFLNYPSFYSMVQKTTKLLLPILNKVLSTKPKIFYEMEERSKA